jgi:hypothetical protein
MFRFTIRELVRLTLVVAMATPTAAHMSVIQTSVR